MSASEPDIVVGGHPMIRHPAVLLRRFCRECGGVASSMAVFMLVFMMLVGGLAVDFSNGVRTRAFLQAVADTAAMSAAQRLPDEQAATAIALALASQNAVAGIHGMVLSPGDIEPGWWYFESQRFVAGGERPNAVRVTTRRDERNANALATLLLGFIGIDRMNVSATAVAFRTATRRCSGGGMFAIQRAELGNSNRFFDSVCLHGDEGVTMNNNNRFDTGTVVSMPDLALLQQGNNNIGLAQALSAAPFDFQLLPGLAARIEALRSLPIDEVDLPDYIEFGPVIVSNINANTPLAPRTLYIVNGSVSLGSGSTYEEVAIVATGSISVNSNVRLHNVVLAADGPITFGSNSMVGGATASFCDTGVYSAYLMSLGSVTFNSNNTLRGIEVAALGNVHFGNSNQATDGIYAEAGATISMNNSNQSRACPAGLSSEVQPGPGGDVRVRTRLML